jgi:hypothetical protein
MKTTKATRESTRALREALAPYLDIPRLRRLAAQGDDLRAALNNGIEPPDVGEVFKEPLRLNSAAIILIHNHPSGHIDASPEDILVTRQIVEAGKLLDCELLDHLIVGQGKWMSLREKGLGFEKKLSDLT